MSIRIVLSIAATLFALAPAATAQQADAAVTAVIRGDVQAACLPASTAKPQLAGGKSRVSLEASRPGRSHDRR